MKAIAELKKEFGTVMFEGIEYVLRQDPHGDYRSDAVNPNVWWSATAVREDDELDEDGEPLHYYRIWWKEREDYDNVNDASDIVNFDDVYDVEEF